MHRGNTDPVDPRMAAICNNCCNCDADRVIWASKPLPLCEEGEEKVDIKSSEESKQVENLNFEIQMELIQTCLITVQFRH